MSYTRPSTIIARILRQLGLKQGHDFRVRGEYRGRGVDRERIGTYVAVLSKDADQVVADHADEIERLSAEQGNSFRVSIHFTAGGRMWTWVANYGQRTRDAAPVATADKGQPALDTTSRRTAHELGHRIVGGAPSPSVRKDAVDAADGRTYLKPGTKARSNAADAMPKLKLGAARPAFEQPQTDAHPYDGLAQRRVGALYWACEEAGQVWFFQDHRQGPRYTLRWYCGRAAATGWRLTGPGLSEGRWLGRTFTTAATAAEDIILRFKWISDRMDECARQWPKGTRVQGVDSYGVTCMGTVNGVSWGVITADGHENYGKTWVDVTWDEMPHNVATGRRNRPLTDSLIRH